MREGRRRRTLVRAIDVDVEEELGGFGAGGGTDLSVVRSQEVARWIYRTRRRVRGNNIIVAFITCCKS